MKTRHLFPALVLVVIGATLWFASQQENPPVDRTTGKDTPAPMPQVQPAMVDVPKLEALTIPVPVATVQIPHDFREWVQSGAETQNLEQGLKMAAERRERMASLIRESPEQALAEALTPRQYARLPDEIKALVERPIAAEGFYGVVAVCSHDEESGHGSACQIHQEVVLGFGTFEAEVFKASIYGGRTEKMTVENDSIYGVALDGHIALHASETVIVDDGEGMLGGRYAVYYKGQVAYAETLENAEALAQLFLK